MARRVFELDIQRIKKNLNAKSDNKRHQNGQINFPPEHHAQNFITEHTVETTSPKLSTKFSNHNLPTSNSQGIAVDDTFGSPHSDISALGSATQPPLRSRADSSAPAMSRDISRTHTLIHYDQTQSFDLAPPPPKAPISTIDGLSERLLSDEHLRVILHDPTLFTRFTAFLNQYKPHTIANLNRYLETQKAIKAVEYANAVAEGIIGDSSDASSSTPCVAALLNSRFEAGSRRAFEVLANDALPAFVAHSLVSVVTDSVVREITGTSIPVLRELLGALSDKFSYTLPSYHLFAHSPEQVFCLTDPSIDDNPIVYASEEFYRTTGYGRDDVIGKNCRFLQGPRSDRRTVVRIRNAIQSGQETSEVLLNYRRDGTPFLNLLLCAPLFDNRGKVRYFIGAQVNISGLVEEGRGLESFDEYLSEVEQQEQQQSGSNGHSAEKKSKKALKTLGEFGQMLSSEESSIIQSSKEELFRDDVSTAGSSSYNIGTRREAVHRAPRLILDASIDQLGEEERQAAMASSLRSGRLPGVYQNYFLVRPSPSLRIIFVSPTLRIPGLLQSNFLSRIGGPTQVREGLQDAFAAGIPVTAKVHWLPHPAEAKYENEYDDNDVISLDGLSATGSTHEPNGTSERKTRWLSCTPLFGSDDRVGVWMVVMVGNEGERIDFSNTSPVATPKREQPQRMDRRFVDHAISPNADSRLRRDESVRSTYRVNGNGHNGHNVSAARGAGPTGPLKGGGVGVETSRDRFEHEREREAQVGRMMSS